MEELKNAIMNVINASPLPLDCKYYIIKDIYITVDRVYYDELKKLKEKGEKDNE